MDYEKIGKFIQELRKEKKLTQKDLAEQIGITNKAVSKWERGLGAPDISILEFLANILGVSVLEILKGERISNESLDDKKTEDYVKYTLHYSFNNQKAKRKRIIEDFVTFFIFCISFILIILNTESILRLNKKYTSDLVIDDTIREYYSEIKRNINIIKNNQGMFTDDDYGMILDDILNIEKYLNYNKILLSDKVKLSKEELYICYSNAYYGYFTLRIIEKYSNDFNYIDYLNLFELGRGSIYENNLLNSYQYQLFNNYYYDGYNADNAIIRTEISLENYRNLTNLVMKVGGISA